jgi:predicted MFS family arabinose efflux permease
MLIKNFFLKFGTLKYKYKFYNIEKKIMININILRLTLLNFLCSINNFLSSLIFPILAEEAGLEIRSIGFFLTIYYISSMIMCFFATQLISFLGKKNLLLISINLMVIKFFKIFRF